MNSSISEGVFQGGEIEPGTFHRDVSADPREGEAPTTHQTGGGDVGPAESESA